MSYLGVVDVEAQIVELAKYTHRTWGDIQIRALEMLHKDARLLDSMIWLERS